MQEFGEKSDDLTGVFNSCWMFGDKNVAFTNQGGTTDERSMSRDELAQSMPCKEEEDESQITNYIGECERKDVILHRHFMDKWEGGLRSGCWHLRSWLA